MGVVVALVGVCCESTATWSLLLFLWSFLGQKNSAGQAVLSPHLPSNELLMSSLSHLAATGAQIAEVRMVTHHLLVGYLVT